MLVVIVTVGEMLNHDDELLKISGQTLSKK